MSTLSLSSEPALPPDPSAPADTSQEPIPPSLTTSVSQPAQGLKVNLHITECCNYRCRGCFSHFNEPQHLSVETWCTVIDKLAESGSVSAINFAGGEPLLFKGLSTLINHAAELGLTTSLITNGSLLSEEFLDLVAGRMRTIGISIDSLNVETSRQLQRCDRQQRCFDLQQLKYWLPFFAERNFELKINTVVNKLNWQERFSEVMAGDQQIAAQLKRWKVLKIKEFAYKDRKHQQEHHNRELLISDEQFAHFCQNNPYPQRVIEHSMVNSYFVVDNTAHLLNNKETGYTYVGSLLQSDFKTLLECYQDFDQELYNQRYKIDYKAS